jgi:L-fuconolactonase
MIGSDWPVCTLSGSYEEVMGIVIGFVDTLTSDERAAILGGTCARFYGIGNESEGNVPPNLEGVRP